MSREVPPPARVGEGSIERPSGSEAGARPSPPDPGDEPPRPHPRVAEPEPKGSGVAILLAAAAVLAAALVGRASLLASSSSGLWQQAVRIEVKRAAAVVEDIRFVYASEAPVAFSIVAANVRAEEYRTMAEGLPPGESSVLRRHATGQETVAEALTESSDIAKENRYATDEGGFDLALRLIDVRNQNLDLVALDPDAVQEDGDRTSRHARLTMATTIPVAVAFLSGALAQAFARRRRLFIALGILFLGAGLALAVAVEVIA
jgi:FlaG/FlaF family flagellin (archaellin)